MFPSGTTQPGGALWAIDSGGYAGQLQGHSISNDVNGRSAPANVTTVLTVTNVNISNNGTGYVCLFGYDRNAVRSNASFLTVLSKYVFVV